MHAPVELLVVDPRAAMRGALRAALEFEDGVHVAGEAGDVAVALREAADGRITAAIVDSRLAALHSRVALDGLRALERHVPVVVMGMGAAALYAAPYAVAGASGYWAKDGELAALVALLQAAVERHPAD